MKKTFILLFFISINAFCWDFSDKTQQVGLSYQHGFDTTVLVQEPQMIAGGLAIGDINNDGWDDIFVVTGETKDQNGTNLNPNKLFISQQNGHYIDMADSFNLSHDDIQSSGPLILDINGNGKRDLIFGSVGSNPGITLYYNQDYNSFLKGNSSFPNINSFGISAADPDKDGDLDLFISRWLQDTVHAYWFNDGSGQFVDVTSTEINATSYRSSFTPVFTDINNDNWVDLLVTSDFSSSKYFINDQTGSMQLQDSINITDENGMGAAVGDYDNDGDLDWFVTSIFDKDGNAEGSWGITGNRLYRNDGQGNFQDVSISSGVNNGYWGWGACFADFNNDMYLDIFHVNGFPSLMAGESDFIDDPSRLFINNKRGGFSEMSSELNLIDTGMGRAILCFDSDKDGDIDILINNNQGQSKYYQNNLDNNNNYISIKLKQDNSNIDAIGAKIQLTLGAITQLRQIIAGGSFASSTGTTQHFGLADNTSIDSILITWPDDSTLLLNNVAINQHLVINKGFTISGHVENSSSQQAITNLQIQVYSANNEFIKNIYTDSNGDYSINNLVAGSYRLLSESDDYINQAFPNHNCGIEHCDSNLADPIFISTNNVDSVNFSLIATTDFYPKLSGLWYNDQQSGHGLQIEVIMSNHKPSIFASWYAHLNGETIWLTGTGPLNKGKGLIDLYITSGTSFPPSFIADDIIKTLWGTLDLQFSDLNNAHLRWQTVHDQFENGSLDIMRLTNLSEALSSNNTFDACQSGTYYNPDQNGHGIMLEVLGEFADSVIISWFTYNNQDQQLWLLANGGIVGNNASLNAFYTINSDFPPNFNSSDLDTVQWGNINLERIDNNNLIMSWQPNDEHSEYGTHSTELTRLTKIKGIDIDCGN